MKIVPIGSLIRDRMTEVGMSQTTLAEKISKTRQTVANIMDSDNIDVNTLALASEALDFDFFKYYIKGGGGIGKLQTSPVSITLNVAAENVPKVLETAFGESGGKVLFSQLPGDYSFEKS